MTPVVRRDLLIGASLLMAAVGCSTKKPSTDRSGEPPGSPTSTGAPTAAAPSTGGAAAAPSTGGAAAAPNTGRDPAPNASAGPAARTAVQPGTSCPTGSRRIDDVPITFDRASLSFKRDRGGGCPMRPVYIAVTGAGNPLPVMVCFDAYADLCEAMLIGEPVTIDLRDALKAAGATAAIAAP